MNITIDWKTALHYAAVGGLLAIGAIGATGVHIPGVTIDPPAAFAAAVGIWTAGRMGPTK